jgi:hypothetical protein
MIGSVSSPHRILTTWTELWGFILTTHGVTVAATVYLQWPLQYLYSACYSINLIEGRRCFLFLKIGLFWNKLESLNLHSCALWTINLSLKFVIINWSQFRPHIQNRKCSSQLFLQVCKVTKILDIGRYLFKKSKHSYSNTYPSLKFHNLSNFERWYKHVKWMEVQYL